MRKIVTISLFALVCGLILSSWSVSLAASIKCASCHDEAVNSFFKGHHAAAWSASKDDYSSCSTCHGSVEEHLKMGGGKETIISFSKGTKQSAEDLNKTCLSCHSKNSKVAFWKNGVHAQNDVSCTTCHSMHKGKVASKPKEETCYSCHKNIESRFRRTSHHPLPEGKISCSDCHDPHGALSHHNLKEDDNRLCYKCHADKRGPFVWEHPPVEENCKTCHEVHGSVHAKLLKQKVPNLCQDCHDWSRHPGSPYDGDSGFTQSSSSNRFYARACLNCHSKIHGSFAAVNPADGGNSGARFVR